MLIDISFSTKSRQQWQMISAGQMMITLQCSGISGQINMFYACESYMDEFLARF